MSLTDLLGAVGKLTKTLQLINERFERQEETLRDLRTECSEIRREITSLRERVAVLEEARKTTAAEARAAVAEAVAELKVRYTEVVSDLRIEAERNRQRQLPSPEEPEE